MLLLLQTFLSSYEKDYIMSLSETYQPDAIEAYNPPQDIYDLLNPFMPNGFSHPYQLGEFISNFRVFGQYFSFFLLKL